MKLAIIGTGRVGRTLAAGLLSARHEVVFGSRNPDARNDLPAPVTALREAAASADVVVNATPGGASLETLQLIGAETLSGRILLDVGNALTEQFALVYPDAGLGTKIQEAFPDTRVVKSLNTVNVSVMTRPQTLPAATTVFLSGNDPQAKKVVSQLLTDLGWALETQIDLGDIATSRATEHYVFLSLAVFSTLNTTAFNICVIR
jgi:predicted dinucleotide-binding enzyme